MVFNVICDYRNFKLKVKEEEIIGSLSKYHFSLKYTNILRRYLNQYQLFFVLGELKIIIHEDSLCQDLSDFLNKVYSIEVDGLTYVVADRTTTLTNGYSISYDVNRYYFEVG